MGAPCSYSARWKAVIHLHGQLPELAFICDRCRCALEAIAFCVEERGPGRCRQCRRRLIGPDDVIRDLQVLDTATASDGSQRAV